MILFKSAKLIPLHPNIPSLPGVITSALSGQLSVILLIFLQSIAFLCLYSLFQKSLQESLGKPSSFGANRTYLEVWRLNYFEIPDTFSMQFRIASKCIGIISSLILSSSYRRVWGSDNLKFCANFKLLNILVEFVMAVVKAGVGNFWTLFEC